MASQPQNMVNNIPPPGSSAGGGKNTTPRSKKILKASFPESPLFDVGFDKHAKKFYENNVLHGVRKTGFCINNFNADYIAAPDISAVPDEFIGQTGAPGMGTTIDGKPWTIPNLAASNNVEFDGKSSISQKSLHYGSGDGTINPSATSKAISKIGLNPGLPGDSKVIK